LYAHIIPTRRHRRSPATGWNIITHPPYGPDLAPSDYNLFLKLEEHLAGTRFSNDDEVKDEIQRFLNDMAAR